MWMILSFFWEGTHDNLSATKAILRGFELIAGLKVNFYKGYVFEINVDQHFLLVAT